MRTSFAEAVETNGIVYSGLRGIENIPRFSRLAENAEDSNLRNGHKRQDNNKQPSCWRFAWLWLQGYQQ